MSNTEEESKSSSSKGGKMTVEEAGRKGGETVAREKGPEFYSEIGKKGGEQVKEAFQAKRKEEDNER